MVTIFVLIDALGWEYVKNSDLLPEVLSYRTEVQTVLGFSSGAIPTLLSGKLPRESGHWNLFLYDPQRSPFRWVRWLRFLPSWFLNTRVMRKGVRFVSQRLSRFGGYFQIYGVPVELLPYFDICEKQDIYRPGGVPGSIFDHLEESGVRYRSYSYHQLSDEAIVREACHDMQARKYDFYFLYLCEFDAFLHDWCKDKAKVEEQIQRYGNLLGEVYHQARSSYGEVDFFVLSDHGMTPKRGGYDLPAEIKALKLEMPRDYLALYDSTMARFWFFNQTARQRIVERLSPLPCGHFLTESEKRHFGLDFSDNRFGDAIFLMNPCILIEPSFMGTRGPEGMHGFHPEDDPYASAVFLANHDPGRPVGTLIDVHELMVQTIAAQTRNPECQDLVRSA
jgi:predicted AlkP superfamily pyrophosphatase or phosphodiesterase